MSVDRASYYNSFRGSHTNKFEFRSPKNKKETNIAEYNFFKWTNNNMYRTSYNDMAKRGISTQRKNSVIPGYLGYVPSLAADSHLSKRITEQSRDVL